MGWTYPTRTFTICSMRLPTPAKICLFRFGKKGKKNAIFDGCNTYQANFYNEWTKFQCHFEGEERDCAEIFIPVITDDGGWHFLFDSISNFMASRFFIATRFKTLKYKGFFKLWKFIHKASLHEQFAKNVISIQIRLRVLVSFVWMNFTRAMLFVQCDAWKCDAER